LIIGVRSASIAGSFLSGKIAIALGFGFPVGKHEGLWHVMMWDGKTGTIGSPLALGATIMNS
jgi:hypothetical protein